METTANVINLKGNVIMSTKCEKGLYYLQDIPVKQVGDTEQDRRSYFT